jgi:hypothetical protein
MRSLIQAPSELYNQLGKTTLKGATKHPEPVRRLIKRIRDNLVTLEESERDVFGSTHKKLKGITRNADGSSKIIDVLHENDQDPVRPFYESALGLCDASLKELNIIATHKNR